MTHIFNEQSKLIDQNGAAYGVKHVGNKPRVSTMPYLFDISEGNIAGHTIRRVLGYNNNITTALTDINELGNVVYPTAAIAMEVDSSSAADAGVVTYTSTATGGSTTTLIDTAQDFTAGNVVAVGDMIILDDDVAYGIVTAVAPTVLTCAYAFSNSVSVENGDNYRVIDKSAGGTGAQVVEIHGLDGDWAEIEEMVVTNGQTAVATTNSYMRINNFHSMLTGTGLEAAGNIDVQSVGGATDYIRIVAGGNMSLACFFTVPAGKKAYITDWQAGSSGTKACRFILRVTRDYEDGHYLPDVFHFEDIVMLLQGNTHIRFPAPIACHQRCDIKVSGIALSVTGEGAAGIGMWLEIP